MQTSPRRTLLNRPVFTQKVFSSESLTVLTTLLHRFTEPGDYQVRVRHAMRSESEFGVRVAAESSQQQVNVDLLSLADLADGGCCEEGAGYELVVGGVMGFYASAGVGGYEVTISHVGEKEKTVVLDNRKGVPSGDYFAVALTRPGRYHVSDENTKGEAEIRVTLPKGERIRTDVPTLVLLGRDGFEVRTASILAGQTLVIQCDVEARLRVELVEDGTLDRADAAGGRGKASYTVTKPSPAQDAEPGAANGS